MYIYKYCYNNINFHTQLKVKLNILIIKSNLDKTKLYNKEKKFYIIRI